MARLRPALAVKQGGKASHSPNVRLHHSSIVSAAASSVMAPAGDIAFDFVSTTLPSGSLDVHFDEDVGPAALVSATPISRGIVDLCA